MTKRLLTACVCICMLLTLLPATVLAANPTYYGIFIAGTEITDENCSNITNEFIKEGRVSYDPVTETLTLDNATIECSEEYGAIIAIRFFKGDNLTIRLIGDNTLTAHGKNYRCIYGSVSDVTIQGTKEDSLTLESDGDSLQVDQNNLTIDGCTINVTSHNWGGIQAWGGTLSIQNGADITVNSYELSLVGENGITITDSTADAVASGEECNTINSNSGNITIRNSTVRAIGTSELAYPAVYAWEGITVENNSTVTAESSGMRGIFTDGSMTVSGSTIMATGTTYEGLVAVESLTVDHSNLTASGKPDGQTPAIITNCLNITASDMTAKGGVQLRDLSGVAAIERSFTITPDDGTLAEFKVDDSNWDGSAAVHFTEGAASPYDAAVTFNENEMNQLTAYRYVHIGQHIHAGGTATCHDKAICSDCGRAYGDVDPDNHVWEDHFTVDKEPTYTEEGRQSIHCKYCDATKDSQAIRPLEDKTPDSAPADTAISAAEKERNAITLNRKTNTAFKNKNLKVTWPTIKEADGYDIYVAAYRKNFKGITKSVTGNQSGSVMQTTIKKIAGKKFKKNKTYKIRIRAYRINGDQKEYIADGRTLHVVSDKNPVYTNAKKVQVSKKKYSIKVGKTAKIQASVIKQGRNKRLLPAGHGPQLSYISSDKTIATVSKNGKITAKNKGKCTIYVQALNGRSKQITVRVR